MGWEDDGDDGGDPGWSLSEMDRQVFGALKEINTGVMTPERAIVAKRGDAIDLGGKFRLTPVGLEITGEVSESEWGDFFQLIQRVQSSLQWLIGDWIAYGEMTLGKTYENMAEITGFSAKTLRNMVYVARAIPMSLRKDTLTFGHHNVVAGLPAPRQQQWLEYAEVNNLSVAALTKAIKGTPDPGEPPAKLFQRDAAAIARISMSRKMPRGKKRADALAKVRNMRAWLDDVERWLEGGDNG
jgi:hypothetical protein